jgi:hypothetical protein
MNRDLTRLMIAVGQSDTPPAQMLTEAFDGMCDDTKAALARWGELLTVDVPRLNALLVPQGIPALPASRGIAGGYCGQ